MKLYQLTHQHRELERLAEVEELDDETVRNTLEALEGEIATKAESVAAVTLNVEVFAQAAEDAAKRLTERAARARKRAAWLREYLLTNMQASGVTRFECPEFRVSIRKNPASVEVTNPGIVPARFMVQPEPPPPRPDKVAIKAALQAGEEVEGCRLTQSERLEIR